KKYIASTMPEAMKQIRSDLGSEAVILNSKEIRQGGMLGLFQKKKLEVVVGIDSKQVTPLHNHTTSNMESTFQNPVDSKDNDRLDVLNEIKYVKKLLVQQVNQSE